jgi:hypothetical protein
MTLQSRAMDLAIKPGQDGHELSIEQSQQSLRVVTVDQDRGMD